MKTTYEVWFKTNDGILEQLSDEHGLAAEWPAGHSDKAAGAAAAKIKSGDATDAWVIEKRVIQSFTATLEKM